MLEARDIFDNITNKVEDQVCGCVDFYIRNHLIDLFDIRVSNPVFTESRNKLRNQIADKIYEDLACNS